MTFDHHNEIPADEALHFMQCRECHKWFDMRSLDDVFFHEDHIDRPDCQVPGPGVRIEPT